MRLILFVFGSLLLNSVFGQYKGPSFPINDKWFWKYGSKGLQEGDSMPDILLGTVMNNHAGKKRISDFNGKLVILDFWDTYCTSCIAGFPKMEKLQKEFGDQIQIILVNTRENESDIRKRTQSLKGFKIPDLPCIVADRPFISPQDERLHPHPLARLFPTVGVPHHVWIDGKGIIQLRGVAENTYADKIRDLLEGKPIQILKNSSTIPSLSNDPIGRYYQQLGLFKKTPLRYGSFITPYTNEIVGAYGARRDFIDSSAQTHIFYNINTDLLTLYVTGASRAGKFNNDSIRHYLIYSPTLLMDFVEFPSGTDTLDFTSNPAVLKRHLTTEEIVRSKYCYEQILPWEVSELDRGEYMVEDLNRYFSVQYGMIGVLENKTVPCYALVRTSGEDKVGAKSSHYSGSVTDINLVNGIEEKSYRNQFLEFVLSDVIRSNSQLDHQLAKNKQNREAFLVLNKTGWPKNKRVTLQLPAKSMRNIADLQKALASYDLGIVQEDITVIFLVFRKTR